MKINTSYDIPAWAVRVGALCLVLLVCGTCPPLAAATPTAARQADRGLQALARGDADAAAQAFERARMDAPDDPVVRYDLGVSRYRQGDFAAAARQFATAVEVPDADLAFAARHNLGNACFKAGDYAQAVGAYEHALALRDDAQTRYNLEEAKRRLEEQMRQQQQQQQQQQNGSGSDQGSGSGGQERQQSGSGSDQGSQNEGQQPGQGSGAGSGAGSGSAAGNRQQQANNDGKQSGSCSGAGSADPRQQANASASPTVDNASGTRTGSGTSSLDDRQRAGRQRDVEKPAAAEEQKGPKPPDASQRAQALHHITIDPERVKAFLEQLEARERQAQLRYRGEKRRRNRQLDPFMMDPEELREYFDQQMNPDGQAPPTPPTSNEPDW